MYELNMLLHFMICHNLTCNCNPHASFVIHPRLQDVIGRDTVIGRDIVDQAMLDLRNHNLETKHHGRICLQACTHI